MARSFSLWQKKRGDRRTGSKLWGRVGQAVFYMTMLGLGAMSLAAAAATQWALSPTDEYFLTGWMLWLVVLVGVSFVIVGGIGFGTILYLAAASQERRTALENQASNIDLLNIGVDKLGPSDRHPNIIDDADDSPGVRLAYRLPITQINVWRLTFAMLFAVASNSVVAVLVVLASNKFFIGRPEWFLNVVTIGVAAIGVWSVYLFLRQLLLHVGIGPTTLEISSQKLRPGSQYQIYLSQEGKLNIRDLKLTLVCNEEATYQQGTDIRTETTTVYRQGVFHKRKLKIEPGEPFQWEGEITIPRQGMHSFKAGHNVVYWRLLVHGEAQGWPTFERGFPLVVYPDQASSAAAPEMMVQHLAGKEAR